LWQILERHSPVKPRYRLDVQIAKARIAEMLGRYDDAWRLLEEVSQDGDDTAKSEALVEMGRIRSRQGAFEDASRLFDEALTRAEHIPNIRAKALRGLGVVESRMGNHGRAQELLEKSAQDSLSAMDKKGMLKAHLELGSVLMVQGEFERAVEHFSKCAAGFGPVDLASTYLNLGVAYSKLGQLGDARQHLENAARLCEETGQPRPRAQAHVVLSEVLIRMGDPASAREHCFEALEVFSELDDRPGVSAAYANLGMVEHLTGNGDASEEYYSESISALDGVDDVQSVADSKRHLGQMLVESGERDRGSALIEESTKLTKSEPADEHAGLDARRNHT
ncbi:MAG TPA: tetratricopeptide repeat protein, partial [Thermoplasmata archaeon]|nr:tetratricopeptide repeat protein [Thermoplasmata archaeon]